MTSQWKVIISWSGRIRLLKYREDGDFTCGRHVITFSQTSQNYCTKRLWAGTDQTTWPAGTSAVTDSSPQSTTAGSGVSESSSLQCKGELTSADYFCLSIPWLPPSFTLQPYAIWNPDFRHTRSRFPALVQHLGNLTSLKGEHAQ